MAYVRAVNVGNFARATIPHNDTCGSDSLSLEPYTVQATCIDGDIMWKEGYNCAIRQDTVENAIIIGAGLGSGVGEPCEEVPLNPEESSAIYAGELLTGGPGCDEIVKSINGVTGSNINIIAGSGFNIYADPDQDARLIIDQSMDTFASCFSGPEDVSSVSLSVDD